MKILKPLIPAVLTIALILSLNSCGLAFYLTNTVADVSEKADSSENIFTNDTTAPEESAGILAPESESGEISTPLMWKVSGGGYNGDFYLFGSIHVGMEDTNYYPGEVYDAYNSCDHIAVESDIIALESDLEAQMKSMEYYIYTDGTTISDHIDGALYNKAKALMTKYGMYNQFMDYYFPIMWQQVIDQILTEETEYSFDYGVDRYFLQNAKGSGKGVLEIEDYMDTYAAMAGLSPETQEFLLSQSLEPLNIQTYDESLSMLYSLWKDGDSEALEAYLFTDGGEYTDDEYKMMEEYNDTLMYKRNGLMVDRAAEYLEDGLDVFYIVGLAHMFGEDGLVQGLSDAGYAVERVEYE